MEKQEEKHWSLSVHLYKFSMNRLNEMDLPGNPDDSSLSTDKGLYTCIYIGNNMAGDDFKLGDCEAPLENFTASPGIFELMDHPFLATMYSGLAEVYDSMHESSKAAVARKLQERASVHLELNI
jgi:hypothetical protein